MLALEGVCSRSEMAGLDSQCHFLEVARFSLALSRQGLKCVWL